MNIFLLGASGEIGGYLYRHFIKEGHLVTVALHNSAGPILGRYNLQSVSSDQSLKNLSFSMEGFDVVINCIIDKHGKVDDHKHHVNQNIATCTKILEAVRLSKVPKYIHFSSIVVLPPCLTNEDYKQSKQSIIGDWYTIAKIKTERLCKEWDQKNPQTNVTIIRPGIVYGAYMTWSKIVLRQLEKSDVILPILKSSCLAVHPVDVARLVLTILEAKKTKSIYYAVNPQKVTWLEYYQKHSAHANTKYKATVQGQKGITTSKKSTSFFNKMLTWGRAAPFWDPIVMRIPLVLKIGSSIFHKASDIHSLSTNYAEPQPYVIENFEKMLYSSTISPNKMEVGQSLGFRYVIPIETGSKNASMWWKSNI